MSLLTKLVEWILGMRMVPYFTHIYLVLCHFFGDFCQSPAPWKILVFPVTGIYSLLGKRDFTILFFDTNFRAFLHGRGGPQVGEVKCGRSPHLSCKRNQIKMKDYMDRRVTSPTWDPPLPWKQALSNRRVCCSLSQFVFGIPREN